MHFCVFELIGFSFSGDPLRAFDWKPLRFPKTQPPPVCVVGVEGGQEGRGLPSPSPGEGLLPWGKVNLRAQLRSSLFPEVVAV